jgi:hypothetical protein
MNGKPISLYEPSVFSRPSVYSAQAGCQQGFGLSGDVMMIACEYPELDDFREKTVSFVAELSNILFSNGTVG